MEDKKKIEITDAGIDSDVLQELAKGNVLEAVKDDKQIKRAILNCMCEFLSEIKHLSQAADDFLNILTICSSDKLTDFFSKLQDNVKKEQTVLAVQEKVKQSHQKSKKTSKRHQKDDTKSKKDDNFEKVDNNVIQFPQKDVE